MEKKTTYNDEIDISKVFKILWKGKVKFLIILLISLILAFNINRNLPTPTISSSTEFAPLFKSDLNNFAVFNSLDLYNINPEQLYNNFVHLLEKRVAIKNAIRKFKIVSKENYKNDEAYERAVSIESYKIKIERIVDPKVKTSRELSNFSLNLKDKDQDKLLKIINYIKNENNRLNILKLENDFNSKINTIKSQDKIEKIKILDQIQDKKEEFDSRLEKLLQDLQFKIEDNEIAIENSVIEYKLKIKRRLQYLREQASIARKLEIPEFTMNIQSISQSTTIISTPRGVANEGPFYLIGYEAIEKEIDILENRDNTKNFANNDKLITQKRILKQDKSLERKDLNKKYDDEVIFLQKKLKILGKNETFLLAAEELFKKSLTSYSNDFESVIFDPYSTRFRIEPVVSFSRLLIIAIFFAIIASLLYLIIEEKIKRIKE